MPFLNPANETQKSFYLSLLYLNIGSWILKYEPAYTDTFFCYLTLDADPNSPGS